MSDRDTVPAAPGFQPDSSGSAESSGGNGVEASLNPTRRAMSVDDLKKDRFLSGATKVTVNNREMPSLAGIPLLSKLGQGGMGAVYLGIHPRLQAEVAIKVLPFHLADTQPEMVQRFFREARLAAQIQSPHLIQVQDVNEENGLFYLVMEYVSGPSAGDYLKTLQSQGRVGLPEDVALDICIAATKGLAAAHERNVVHRDLKPDNIMLPQKSEDAPIRFSEAKLADLGLARHDSVDSGLTGSQIVMGTLGFMAPEQAMDAKRAGPPADIFGMGATLYALLGGQPPFKGDSTARVLMATLQEPHKSIQELRPDVTKATNDLLNRCLSKEPGNRHASGSELLKALEACKENINQVPDLAPTVIGKAPQVRNQAPRIQVPASPGQSNWAVAGGIAAGIFLLGMGVWFLLGRSNDEGRGNNGTSSESGKRPSKGSVSKKESNGSSAGKMGGRDPMALGKVALKARRWVDAQQAFAVVLNKDSGNAQAASGVVSARAGQRADELLAEAHKALTERRYQDAEAHLQALGWIPTAEVSLPDLIPGLSQSEATIREKAGRGMLRGLTAHVAQDKGYYVFDESQNAEYRWAVGLLAKAGVGRGEVLELKSKLQKQFRFPGLPGANVMVELPSLKRTEGRLRALDPSLSLKEMVEDKDKSLLRAINGLQPLFVAFRFPYAPQFDLKTLAFGIRVSPQAGEEVHLRNVLGILSFWLSGGRPNLVKREMAGPAWILSNELGWLARIRGNQQAGFDRAFNVGDCDLVANVHLQDWVRHSNRKVQGLGSAGKDSDRLAWDFIEGAFGDLQDVALRARIDEGGLWIRTRWYPQLRSDLQRLLKEDSPLLDFDRMRVLPKNTMAAACASSRTAIWSLALDKFLARFPLSKQDRERGAEAARSRLIQLTRAAQKQCGPFMVAGLVPGSGLGGREYFLFAADLPDGEIDMEAFKAGLKELLFEGARLDHSKSKGMQLTSPDQINELPMLRHDGLEIHGLSIGSNLDELRFTTVEGRLLCVGGPKKSTRSPIIQAIAQIRSPKQSILEAEWFRRTLKELPRQAGMIGALDPDPSKENDELGVYARVLDGFWSLGWRVRAEGLKDAKPKKLKLGLPDKPAQNRPLRPKRRF